MRRAKLSLFLQFLVCGSLLCTGIATAQSPDRILTFDSRITVDRGRTMHVEERFEIANETGFFDTGFHRRLGIKPTSPQRAKPGSFQPIGAKVDGHDTLLHASKDRDVFDIGISSDTGTLSRGNHVIELSYTAKHQFAIYDDFGEPFSLALVGLASNWVFYYVVARALRKVWTAKNPATEQQ